MLKSAFRVPYIFSICLAALLLALVHPEASPAKHSSAMTCRQLKSNDLEDLSWTIAGRQTELNEWCATVGPALYRAPSGAGVSRNGRILVVDWNVHLGNGKLEALINDLKRKEQEAGRSEPDFVFLLQEAYRRSADVPAGLANNGSVPARISPGLYDIQGLANRLDWWMFYVPSMRNGEQVGLAAEDRGNAILSSLRLEALQAIELPFSVQRRVAVSAIVDDPHRDLRFRVATVHLDTRAPMTRGSIFGAASARNAQARSVADSVRGFSEDGMSLILGGDLNSYWGPWESSLDTLATIAPHMSCGTKTHATGFTLDHMFARFVSPMSSTSCRRANDRFESDHYPLVLALDAIAAR